MDPTSVGLAGIFILFGLLFVGMPIGYALACVGLGGISVLTSLDAALPTLARAFYHTFSQYSFMVIPLFVIMGELATASGLSQGVYNLADKWLRRLPGGQAIATIGACAGFSAICGSSVATAATLGRVALPEMQRCGYDERLASGSVAAGGSLGFLIPPSIGFVVYGILTEQSVGRLLMSGILPGLLMVSAFIITIIIWVYLRPEIAPVAEKPVCWAEKIKALAGVWELLVAFGAVMGGIYTGIFTPTEAGALGAFFLFWITLFKGRLTLETLSAALRETTRVTLMIFMILAGAYLFTYFMALTMIPHNMATWLAQLPLSPYLILAFILTGYLVLGCFLDATSMMVLTLPVIFPTILQLGFDPIWFGVIAVLMMEAGLITPPLGLNIFVITGCSQIPATSVLRGSLRFLIAVLVVVVIVTLFPQIALFLPGLMRGS